MSGVEEIASLGAIITIIGKNHVQKDRRFGAFCYDYISGDGIRPNRH